jgi:hypothetical protein
MQGMRRKWFCTLAGVALIFLYACGGGGDSTPAPPAPADPVVTTLSASNVTLTSATLNGSVNPNGQATEAWFEYGFDNTLAPPFTATAHVPVGSGTVDNAVSRTIPVSGDNTVYFRVVAVVIAGGTEQRGAILSFEPLNPPPVAVAGPDQQDIIMGKEVTLDGSGSSTPIGVITTYLWQQVAGTPVVLSDNGVVSPTFTAPDISTPSEDLVFQLTITDSRSMTSQDNVTVMVVYGAFDDFSTDTSGSYTAESIDLDGNPAVGSVLSYDAVGERLEVTTGNDLGLIFSRDFPAPGIDNGEFSIDFTPIGTYPSGGGIWVRLMEDADNYYELAIFNWDDPGAPGEPAYFAKVVGGVDVDNVPITMNNYDNVATRTVTITFTPTSATATGFLNGPVTLTGDNTVINVSMFEIQSNQQDVYYDNIEVKAVP